MAYSEFDAEVNQGLIALNSEFIPGDTGGFSQSGRYLPRVQLIDASNVLPTKDGYISFFGSDLSLGDDLDKDIQEIHTVRLQHGDTILVALCKDGFYIKSLLGDSAPTVNTGVDYVEVIFDSGKCTWTKLDFAANGVPNPWALWTYALVKEHIYYYQQGLGHVIDLSSSIRGTIRADFKELTSLVGTYDVYNWTVDGIDNNLTCTDTQKELTISTLGSAFVDKLDKAHYVSDLELRWNDTILQNLDTGFDFTLNSKVLTDLAAHSDFTVSVPTERARVPGEELLSDTAGPVLIGAGVNNNLWTFSLAGAGSDTGCYYEYDDTTKKLTLHAANGTAGQTLYLVAHVATAATRFIECIYSFDGAASFALFGFSPVLGNTIPKVYSIDPTYTTLNGPIPGDLAGSGYSSFYVAVTGVGSCTVEITNLEIYETEYIRGVFTDPPGLSPTTYLATGTYNRWIYAINNNTPTQQPGGDIEYRYLPQIKFNYDSIRFDAVPNLSSAGEILTLEIGCALLSIYAESESIFLGEAHYVLHGGTTSSEYSIPVEGLAFGYVISDTQPEHVDRNTTDAVVIGILHEEDLYNINALGGFYTSAKQQELLKGLIPEIFVPQGKYLTFFTEAYGFTDGLGASDYWFAHTSLEIIGIFPATSFHGYALAQLKEWLDTEDSQASNMIALSADGEAGELTWSWDLSNARLLFGGFKKYGLTRINILFMGEILGGISLVEGQDSNDIYPLITAALDSLLGAAFSITHTKDTSCEANVDYTINLYIADFFSETPTLSLSNDGNCTWSVNGSATIIPTLLSGVVGITSARGRLVAWDFSNALYRSSNLDPLDFTTSLETQAGVGKSIAVIGRVIYCKGYENGFMIYSDGNIVRAIYTNTDYVFNYNPILPYGVIDPRHIAGSMQEHYVFTNAGLFKIATTTGEVSQIGSNIIDTIIRYKWPVSLQYLDNRYLLLSILETPVELSMSRARKGDTSPIVTGEFTGLLERFTGEIALDSYPYGANLFPTYKKVLIYDTVLDKWGIGDFDFKTIFSVNPINSLGFSTEKSALYSEQAYHNYIKSLGGVLSQGELILFNDNPLDSYVCYGRYRLDPARETNLLFVRAEFTTYPNCSIEIEPCRDGRVIDFNTTQTFSNIESPLSEQFVDDVAQWFNVLIRGRFELRRLTFRGTIYGEYIG